jgi:formylglycine-generating enzyme required for sulfatase activity
MYSLGLVLYEMLAGRLPFTGDTPVAVLVQRLQVQPLPPERVRPDLNISPDVSELVMRALEKERENRYRSAAEMERGIAVVLDSWRAERDRREREWAEAARLVAAGAERQKREMADAVRLEVERTEREQQDRERAEAVRLAAERPERERPEREMVGSASEAQRERVGAPGPQHRRSGTTVLGRSELSRRWRIGFIVAAVLTLVGIGFSIARSLTEKTAQEVLRPKAGIEALPRTAAQPVQPAERENEKPAAGTLVEKRRPEPTAQQSGTRAGPAAKAEGLPRIDTRAEAAGPASAATALANPKDGLRYVWIPPGKFTMGCSAGDVEGCHGEEPAHQATITKGFWLGQTEVTQAAYKRVVGTDPSYSKGAELPVEQVSWDEAQGYCQAAGGRLPTEAEWEYAARAGSPKSRYGNIDRIAWYQSNSGGHTHEVAQKEANAWGLYDMLGNVREWTADWYGPMRRV